MVSGILIAFSWGSVKRMGQGCHPVTTEPRIVLPTRPKQVALSANQAQSAVVLWTRRRSRSPFAQRRPMRTRSLHTEPQELAQGEALVPRRIGPVHTLAIVPLVWGVLGQHSDLVAQKQIPVGMRILCRREPAPLRIPTDNDIKLLCER